MGGCSVSPFFILHSTPPHPMSSGSWGAVMVSHPLLAVLPPTIHYSIDHCHSASLPSFHLVPLPIVSLCISTHYLPCERLLTGVEAVPQAHSSLSCRCSGNLFSWGAQVLSACLGYSPSSTHPTLWANACSSGTRWWLWQVKFLVVRIMVAMAKIAGILVGLSSEIIMQKVIKAWSSGRSVVYICLYFSIMCK